MNMKRISVFFGIVVATASTSPLNAQEKLTELSATEAAKLIRAGKLKSEDLVKALCDQIESKKDLGAFISYDREAALKAARAADEHIPGGSSGGTGVAIAARMAAAGLGSDTGGSVRIPAALNGITGLRPTLKRYSQDGITPIAHTRDTAGPMARTVEDLLLLDNVITGAKDKVP